jgi:hypothetical protein
MQDPAEHMHGQGHLLVDNGSDDGDIDSYYFDLEGVSSGKRDEMLSLVAGEDVGVRFLGNTISTDPAGITKEMFAFREMYRLANQRIYLHFVIAYSHDDSRVAPIKSFVCHLDDTMSEFLPDAQWVASLHHSKDHKHWHIAVNMVDMRGFTIDTNLIFDKLRDVSDKHAVRNGLSVIVAPVHTVAVNKLSKREMDAIKNGSRLDITVLKNKINSILKITRSNNFLMFRNELAIAGIDLYRNGPDGGLVYGYGDGFYKASVLGGIMQLYGIKCVQSMGYDSAVEHIESLPRDVRFKVLNAACVDEDYFYLTDRINDAVVNEDIKKREVFCIAIQSMYKSRSVNDYKFILSTHNIDISEKDAIFIYTYGSHVWQEREMDRALSKQEVESFIASRVASGGDSQVRGVRRESSIL